MKGKIVFILSLIVILFSSCEYEPKDVYQREVDRNVTSPVIQSVNLTLASDTVYVYYNMPVSFTFASSKQKIQAVRFIIDNVEGATILSSGGVYRFEYSQLSEGIHYLEIKIYTATGTGSIADNVGAESFVFSKEWTLKVVKNYSGSVIKSVFNGFLKLSWSNYLGPDLKNYVIYKKRSEYDPDKIFKKLTAMEFIDSSYFGDQEYYNVAVETESGYILDWGNVMMIHKLPDIKLLANKDNQYTVTWGKFEYYNAIQTFQIYQDLYFNYSLEKIKETGNPDDTTCSLAKIYFADAIRLVMKIMPKYAPYDNEIYYDYQSESYAVVGYPFINNQAYGMKWVNNSEFCFTYTGNIYRYSITQMNITDEIDFTTTSVWTPGFDYDNLFVSSSGKTLSAFLLKENYWQYVSASTMSLKDYIHKNPAGLLHQRIPITDSSVCAFKKSDTIFLYNLKNSSILGKYPIKSNPYGGCMDISSDGKYLIVNDDSVRLVHFDGSQFKTIGSLLYNFDQYCEFDRSDETKILAYDMDSFHIIKRNDFSDLSTISLYAINLINVDYTNKEVLAFDMNDNLSVINLADGSLIEAIPINRFSENYSNDKKYFFLMNHCVFSKNGVVYFVKNKK